MSIIPYLKLQGELVGGVLAHVFEVSIKVIQLHGAATTHPCGSAPTYEREATELRVVQHAINYILKF